MSISGFLPPVSGGGNVSDPRNLIFLATEKHGVVKIRPNFSSMLRDARPTSKANVPSARQPDRASCPLNVAFGCVLRELHECQHLGFSRDARRDFVS